MYSNSCQPDIINETPETFPDLETPTTITDTAVKRPKTDIETTYLKNINIDEAIRKKLRNKH